MEEKSTNTSVNWTPARSRLTERVRDCIAVRFRTNQQPAVERSVFGMVALRWGEGSETGAD